jgi:cellulose synthase/poly-beta-1,6-N-acetylglucosamine synthase-like glycosyltransferase
MSITFTQVMTAFSLVLIAYITLRNLAQLTMSCMAGLYLLSYQRRRNPRNLALATSLAAPPLVSVVVPARNEALTIVESLRALLALDYEPREIVVVNDGSTDDTLSILQTTFRLVAAPVAFDRPLKTAPVRGVYRSIDEPSLLVVDKQSGGSKGDACNAGINAASGALVLVIDADTVLEADSLTRATLPFLEDASTVAVGGYVAIANGCLIEHGRVVDVRMPHSWLARFQIVDYMRSFLIFRLACASRNAVTIISGAFGLFLKSAVIEVGGYDRTAIGEDMDLTLRLQRFYRERGRPIRIGFAPLPVCWTQAPEDLTSLGAQRRRWRRGLLQVLWRQRTAIGNPRFGAVGLFVLPYTAIFEGLGPLIEFFGYAITTAALIFGVLNWGHYRVLLAVSLLLGGARSLVALLLSDIGTGRYMRVRDLGLLFASVALEHVGFRQLNTWWGVTGTAQALTGKGSWGSMRRKAF